jgi:outer membrane protein assembly factor BamB/TolA-binding protein
MKTEEFIDILEQRQLVSASVVQSVREKIAKGDRRITPRSLLKFLVKKELITQSQAKQLLQSTLTVSPSAESSILGTVLPPDVPVDESLQLQLDETSQEELIPTLTPVEPTSEATSSQETSESAPTEDELASISGFVSESLSDADTGLTDAGDEAKGRLRKKKTKNKRGRKNEFDTPLLLLGGGGLIVLILAGTIIGWLLLREDADAILRDASQFYDGGSYTQAVNQYDRFVTNFPRHPQISEAKVKLGLATIWKASSGTSQFSRALVVAKEVLETIEEEDEFESAKRDLSSQLPTIARGLATQAEKASNPEEIIQFVAEAKEALALCNNTKYLPSTYRDDVELNEILETLDRVERAQEQNVRLAQALKDIQEAIDAQDTAKAYAIHKQLTRENPWLTNNESLAEKIRAVSAAEKGNVRFIAEARAAQTSPRTNPVVAQLALAGRRGASTGLEGIVPVRVDGALYALNMADGKLLWRSFVGLGANLPSVALPDGDFLVVDALHHELLRLKGETGRLVWRQAFDGPIIPPVPIEGRLLVTERAGRLHVLEAASGDSLGYVQFEQALPVPPAVVPQEHRIYVVGDHSSVYTLNSDDYACLGVFFLGHTSGSMAVPPVLVLNKVVVAKNSGVETSNLYALARNDEALIGAIDTSRRLEGLITTPLLVAGRRVVALTTLGQVIAFEVGSGGGEESLDQIAARDAESGTPIARFGLLHKGHVWSAGKKLSKLAILPTGNRLRVRDIDFDYVGDTFDYPLQLTGDVVVHVRRPKNRAGAIVAAMNTSSGKAHWETELAVPLAGAPAVDTEKSQITAVTASGAAYVFDRQALGKRIQDKALRLRSGPTLTPLVESADLRQGRLAISSAGAKFILHFRPDTALGSLTSIQLASPLSCPPIAWNENFVAPTQVGQVYLYDGETAEQIGSPFQPALAADGQYNWLTPAVYVSGESSQLVLCDGVAKVYLLQQTDQPQPNIQAVAETGLGNTTIQTRLAVVGDTVFAGDKNGQLVRFSLPSLERKPDIDLESRIVWGPFDVAGQLLFTTERDELVCVDAEGQVTWREPLAHGQPNGKPLAEDDAALVLWQQGGLSRILLRDGSESKHVQLEQPMVAGPLAFGSRLILASSDGTLLVIERP